MLAPPVRTRSIDEMGVPAYRTYLDALGSAKMHAQRRFLSELPEVQARGLARTWGFESVHVFAAKVGGVSRVVVDEVLRLHRALGSYEALWSLLRRGLIGWTKLRTIQKAVTPETERWWAHKLKFCSKRQLEDEVRRLREEGESRVPGRENLGQDAPVSKGGAASQVVSAGAEETQDPPCEEEVEPTSSRRRSRSTRLTVHPSQEELALLEALRARMRRQRGGKVSLEEAVRWAIRQAALGGSGAGGAAAVGAPASTSGRRPRAVRNGATPVPALLVLYRNEDTGELRIPTREGLTLVDAEGYGSTLGAARSVALPDLVRQASTTEAKPGSRHVPQVHQQLVAARHGNRCAFPGCLDLATEVHHVVPLSEGGRSEADNLAPTCDLHHDALHSGWVEGAHQGCEQWRYAQPGRLQVERPADEARRRMKAKAVGDDPEGAVHVRAGSEGEEGGLSKE